MSEVGQQFTYNPDDEAMHRRYSRRHGRFDQPDPYDGSYDLTDPQSFNRYAYVRNDPVNFVDPSGLDDEFVCQVGDPRCVMGSVTVYGGGGFGGLGGLGGGVGGAADLIPIAEVGTGTEAGGGDTTGGAGGGIGDLAATALNRSLCDDKLAKLFGGPGAIVGSTHDPGSLQFYQTRGWPPNAQVPRGLLGHGPAPFKNPNPKSADQGGIIHIYGNAEGTAMNVGLYAPNVKGMKMGRIFTTPSGNVQRNVRYPGGITIAFVHVIPYGGSDRNAMGSVRIGNIGGPDSSSDPGYRHTHIVFFKNGARVDPRSLYCNEFGF